ncbi:MAG TPA: glycosyltransferase family 4 protein [Candidatus Bathyarchaeia archaeon]|nr:glycosyltransferase family 4 protein [Candidatus Bathyarchaeia archaeon]
MTENQQKKGVILVSFEYPPRRLSNLSDIIQKLARTLITQGYNVWIVTFDDWRSGIEKNNKMTIVRIPYNVPNNISFFSNILNLKSAYQSAIASIINTHDINLIHFFEWQTLPLLIPWGEKLVQKIIVSISNIQLTRDSTFSPYNNGIMKIEQMSLKTADLIFANSDNLATKLIANYKISEEKMIVQSLTDRKIVSKISDYYTKILDDKITNE